jgi:hypothetical protein
LQAEVVSRQFVFEFVNATFHGRSTVVIAPDFQGGFAAIGNHQYVRLTSFAVITFAPYLG